MKPNGFDINIELTFQEENTRTVHVPHIIIFRKCNSFVITVFRKSINNDIYLYQKAFARDTWKRENLKKFVEREKVTNLFRKSFP